MSLSYEIETKLKTIIDPYLKLDLMSAKIVKKITVDDTQVNLELIFPYSRKTFDSSLIDVVKPICAGRELTISSSSRIDPHVGQKNIKALPQVKNIIAIASGKGGVGKSTVSVNLALALAKEGARVGLLDADIHGPSQPTMLGINERPKAHEEKKIIPIDHHGIQSMSIGYLIDANTPMIWRGPMVSMALQQLLNDTQWDNLDYLVIDLPPGTGDIQLTLAQKIPVSGAVIVTTPQELALLDARRAIEMFRKVNVPILGIVENMSIHACSHCGHEERIFGEGGGQVLATEFNVDLLGSLPLDKSIREMTDSGTPPVVAEPTGLHANLYRELAKHVGAKIALQPKDYSNKFPTITVK